MKLALAQLNLTVGDIEGNEAKILDAYRRGADAGVELIVVPELALTGYPPRDLVIKRALPDKTRAALERLAAATGSAGLLVGFVDQLHREPGRVLSNSAALAQHGKILATRAKSLLPSYDVFDEDRYFQPASANDPVEFNGRKIGITICEDIWNDEDFWPERRYQRNPPVELARAGAEILFNLSASPWSLGRDRVRSEMLRCLAVKTGRPVVLCNQVGGNDELIFDGSSLVFNGRGELVAHARMFEEELLIADTDAADPVARIELSDEEAAYRALILGLRDYFQKCGFQSAVLGISGGIDSAVVACLAVAALGPENVRGVSLPSHYSSQGSLDDAQKLAKNLGIRYDVIPIRTAFETVRDGLSTVFEDRAEDTTEENIQARLRGVNLMAISNKFGSLLLTTGNKSELGVGYCTLYGDMCGGLAVISDVPKTLVYRLARWINREREIIPAATLTKPPSAELRPDQKDQDTLPAYDVLDEILHQYVVEGKSRAGIVDSGFDAGTVNRVVRLIDINEYKRRQAAPGLRITSKAFGMGRRIPLAQRWTD